ncbi:MAG TPA: DinB family protein [Ohtaekwangia sp.]|uniref:DinB family protein n=1 Tax=Ohtaekwangia sp. TaxID=2066019 RepID=UPI002F94E506
MPIKHILINLTRELIRTFAVVDEWFDKEHSLHCYKPASGGWCVHEVLEHIMLTNHYLLVIIEKGCEKALRKHELLADKNYISEGYTLANPALLAIGKNKSFEWQRPEHHRPTGEKPLEEIRRAIRDQLARCLDTIDQLPGGEGVLHQTTMSVNNLGKLDVYQYIYFLSLHVQRHLQQLCAIEEEFKGSSVAFGIEGR